MKVLITGAGGYIGNYLFNKLKFRHEVEGTTRSLNVNGLIQVDLLDSHAVMNTLKNKKYDLVIHCAAIAHGQAPPSGETIISANNKMTVNIIEAVKSNCNTFILMSSVSVYCEEGFTNPICVLDTLKPCTDYGKSKTISEELVLKTGIKNIFIFRLAPVFSESNLVDVKKRIQIPFFRLKFFTSSNREYSLCSLYTIYIAVQSILANYYIGKWIFLLSDKKNYQQDEILTWFDIKYKIKISSEFIDLFYLFLKCFPFESVRALRVLFWKLFKSVVYENQAYNIKKIYY